MLDITEKIFTVFSNEDITVLSYFAAFHKLCNFSLRLSKMVAFMFWGKK